MITKIRLMIDITGFQRADVLKYSISRGVFLHKVRLGYGAESGKVTGCLEKTTRSDF